MSRRLLQGLSSRRIIKESLHSCQWISSKSSSSVSSLAARRIVCVLNKKRRIITRQSWLPRQSSSILPSTFMISWPNDKGATARLTTRFFSSQRRQGNHDNDNNNYYYSQKRRQTSSSSGGGGLSDVQALPFSVSPKEALAKFHTWADEEQGLSYLLSQSSVKLQAAYCPVWAFGLNFRFVVVTTDTDTNKQTKRLDWKPTLLQQAYGSSQSIVHLPGVAAYAGYNYRRSLVNAVHNTSLIFLQDDLVPFEPAWMLEPMPFDDDDDNNDNRNTGNDNNQRLLEINPDPWNATRRRALAVVQEEWQSMAAEDYFLHNPRSDNNNNNKNKNVEIQVQMQMVSAQRVYMPTYVVDYTLLGATSYQAIVSGADQGAAVSGVSHQLWSPTHGNIFLTPDQQAQFAQQSVGLLQQAYQALQTTARVLGPRNVGVLAVAALQVALTVVRRVLLRIPIIAGVVGLWIAIRKILWPYWANRYATADWEAQREQENASHASGNIRGDDFVDTTGTAERFFNRNRQAILQALQGTTASEQEQHQQGDWYEQWVEWARRVYEEEQRGFQQQQQQQYGQQQGRTTRQQRKTEYAWDFDPNDPYSVLKIPRTATSQEISQAFRREMLKFHPDRMTTATKAEQARATERSKLISEAYQKLKKAR